MIQINNQSFLRGFDHIYALTSDKRNIENYALRLGVFLFLLKKVNIILSGSSIDRTYFQNYLIDQVVSYYQRNKKKNSVLGLIQIEFECKIRDKDKENEIVGLGPIQIKSRKSKYEMNYFIMRKWIYGQPLKMLIRSQQQEIFQLPTKQLVHLLLDLFISTIDFNHSIISTSNIFVEQIHPQKNQYRFGLHYTSVSDYLFLILKKMINFQQFKEIYPYLHQDIFNVKQEVEQNLNLQERITQKLSFKLKIHSFAVILLQIFFKKEISLKISKIQDQIGPNEATNYLIQISEKYKNILKLSRVSKSISEASKQLNINEDSLQQFFATILTINNGSDCQSQPYRKKFCKWSKIIKLFDKHYFESQKIILKMYPKQQLAKIWQNEPRQSKEMYQRWGIIRNANMSQTQDEDYILYAMHKFQLFERPIIVNKIDDPFPKYYQIFPPKKILKGQEVNGKIMKIYPLINWKAMTLYVQEKLMKWSQNSFKSNFGEETKSFYQLILNFAQL